MSHEITLTMYISEPKKLAVIFPAKAHNLIQDLSDATGATKSDIARAAILTGLDDLEFALTENGMLNLKGWIAALNGKVK